jgi:hypothetical protein
LLSRSNAHPASGFFGKSYRDLLQHESSVTRTRDFRSADQPLPHEPTPLKGTPGRGSEEPAVYIVAEPAASSLNSRFSCASSEA